MEKTHNILITVSRQIASGGTYVARMVAKRLSLKYVDRDVLRKAAEYFGTDEETISYCDEKAAGFWDNLMKAFYFGTPETPYMVSPSRPIYERELFEVEVNIIKNIARECNAIIVGRGGLHILKGHPGLVNVFLHAPLSFRIKRIMAVHNITDKDSAISEIKESDRRREKFLRSMTGMEWTDARNYHLCLDTSASGFEAAEEMIVRLVDKIRHKLGQQ